MPAPDHVVPAWYMGLPVMMRSFEWSRDPIMVEGQVPESLPYDQTIGYIVGIVDSAIGASPHQTIPTPGGAVSMPGHQGVLPCLHTPDAPSMGIAYSVVPGPNATAYNVRVDPMPPRSVIGAPLATHIKVGPSWTPLTSHTAIELGLHKGWLRLKFFGANPIGWATPNWDENYAFMPEMVRPCTQPRRAERRFMDESGGPPIPAH